MMLQPIPNFLPQVSIGPNEFAPNEFAPNGFVPIVIVPISIVLLSLAFLTPFPSKADTGLQTLGSQTLGPQALGPETLGSETSEPQALESEASEPQAPGQQTPKPQTSRSQNQVLILAPDRRIEASICPDSMNRIAIANDRITRIFGDDGTFESQNDEDTGQVFLKPTAENGTKGLSITLVTEQGITQDLTLKPTAPSARTLIFKHAAPAANRKTGQEIHQGGSGLSSRPFEANPFDAGLHPSLSPEQTPAPYHHLLTLLKKATAGQLPLQESGSPYPHTSRPGPEGLQVSHHQSYAADPYPYDVHAFHVENTVQTAIEMQEKSFYQPGDLAISLQKRILPPGAKTLLYVVRLSEALVPETHAPETLVLETRGSETPVLETRGPEAFTSETRVSGGGGHD